MDWLAAPDYYLARLVIQRGLGVIYLIAFVVAVTQFRPLLGERGLLPVPRYARLAGWSRAPSLFTLRYSDRLLAVVAWTGIGLAALVVLGLPERGPIGVSMLVWFALWALYLSIVNVGQTFYGFGWESLLLEAGFLAMFLGPAEVAPPLPVIFLLRWLLFRVEFGAGLIKLRGDPCWRRLTCLDYHHETQPMPNPLSWWFHRLPAPLHRMEVAANHVTQLVVPFLLFTPQPYASVAGVIMIVTQGWLVLSGNFSWLNVVTMTLAFSALDNRILEVVLPASPPASLADPPAWFGALTLALAATVAVLSWWPARNMLSSHQAMNLSFNRLHLVNTYGAFGTISRERNEVVIEGTDDATITPGTDWRPYEFKGKPGDPRRRPPQVAPYHLRLDWLMWFAALSPAYAEPWLPRLASRLLEGDEPTLRLLHRRGNPFPDAPPAFVRARLFRYRYTTRAERRTDGAWWVRTEIGIYLPPVRRAPEATASRP
ncbi:MAG TPA: lipase maturation factor family protein [Acidimicrobiales bacterium]|nr:lipase maturation factor family protein [Acidimicrobiales bacterium]